MTDRELMQMALTHLEHSIGVSDESQKRLSELKKAMRDRLKQPEPEPTRSEQMRDAGYDGMKLRDYFAAQAMLVVKSTTDEIQTELCYAYADYETRAELCYAYADAMLEARNK